MEAAAEIERLRRRTCSFASEYQPFAITSDPRRKMRVYHVLYSPLQLGNIPSVCARLPVMVGTESPHAYECSRGHGHGNSCGVLPILLQMVRPRYTSTAVTTATATVP